MVEPVETVAVDAGATTVLGPTPRATTHFAGGRVIAVGVWPTIGAVSLTKQVGLPEVAVVSGSDAFGPGAYVDSAATALAAHADRSSGRLVRFAGREEIERETTVGDVLRLSEVDAVVALGGLPLPDRTPLDLREWARPELRSGRAELMVQETFAGLVPFDSRKQRACCAVH